MGYSKQAKANKISIGGEPTSTEGSIQKVLLKRPFSSLNSARIFMPKRSRAERHSTHREPVQKLDENEYCFSETKKINFKTDARNDVRPLQAEN